MRKNQGGRPEPATVDAPATINPTKGEDRPVALSRAIKVTSAMIRELPRTAVAAGRHLREQLVQLDGLLCQGD